MSIDYKTISTERAPRVLHVLEATIGGTLRYMENIAEATAGLDIISGFAYGTARADSRLNPFLQRISDLGWASFPVDMIREVNLLNDLKAWFQLRRIIDHFTPDIIHCHSSKAGALGRTSVLLCRKHPARVYSPHALAAPLGSIYLHIEKLLSKFTERFVAVSDTERQELVDYSLAVEDSVSVVYPSIDIEYFRPSLRSAARQILKIGSGPLVIAIGRLTTQKDPLTFLRVIEQVYMRQPEIQAVWVGSGEIEMEFLNKIALAKMQHVIRVIPWQHDVRFYISAADVLVSTSRFESFGYVAAEALAMKRPVVASDVTGTRDIMQRSFREWLYPPDRSDLAAELILKLVNNPALSEATGELGRSHVEELFSIERMGEGLMQVYGSILSRTIQKLTKEVAAA